MPIKPGRFWHQRPPHGALAAQVPRGRVAAGRLPSKVARHARIKFAFATQLPLTTFCETNILYVEIF
jgi:hypothetical protein